ncbi:hypothetical protein GGR32_000141 [Mesonia hippocampi]|uniref:Oxidase n=1 Tax=Mesonia hippocampi TaxID=1628250 RepID=A0A840EHH0_9FLAO|nr:oxidase [Mesonia hippocampi]MBB4117869.1 hypothetical protein [Mesonia hippocampi]
MARDILIDDTGDLKIENGDFGTGNPTIQNQRLILISHKGEFKEAPELGVGISNELLNENPKKLLREIKRNFEYDGMKVKTLQIGTNDNLIIDATYIN